MINYRALSGLFLRLSLGAIFLYFGIQAAIQPEIAMSYIPAYAEAIFANSIFMIVWSTAEILVGVALIIGLFPRIAAYAAAIMLIPIIIAVGFNEVMYRDIVIFAAAIHLAYEPAYLWAVKA